MVNWWFKGVRQSSSGAMLNRPQHARMTRYYVIDRVTDYLCIRHNGSSIFSPSCDREFRQSRRCCAGNDRDSESTDNTQHSDPY